MIFGTCEYLHRLTVVVLRQLLQILWLQTTHCSSNAGFFGASPHPQQTLGLAGLSSREGRFAVLLPYANPIRTNSWVPFDQEIFTSIILRGLLRWRAMIVPLRSRVVRLSVTSTLAIRTRRPRRARLTISMHIDVFLSISRHLRYQVERKRNRMQTGLCVLVTGS